MGKLEVIPGTMKLDHHCTSVAAKVYCEVIREDKSVAMARLYGEISRCMACLEDLEAGLPPLAAGMFTDVDNSKGEWDGIGGNMLTEIPSSMCEYISGSGTRYLLCIDHIIARIKTEETRTEIL